MGAYQVLPILARVGLRAMAMKGCSAFPKAPELLEPRHLSVWSDIQGTRWEGFIPQQRSSQCILQPQPTGQNIIKSKVGDQSQGRLKGSLFNSYNTEVLGRATPFPGLLHFTLDPYLIMLSVK